MPINMSYCKFENTFHALQQCWENWDIPESDSETEYKRKLISLIARIAIAEGYIVDETKKD